ncbi:unnamed protein product [Urochloa decumbens]|uniref:KIB1-4 beta-propeller domain-containing protein n=1 Tax=Urochloa decumbens TaxID=240449 RepID=A0ABC9AV57_9POAL
MAEPPPPLPPRTLEDLSDDLQRLILIRIPCAVDRGRMSLVCRAWRDEIRRHRGQLAGPLLQQPPPLPWLLLRAPAPLGLGFGSTRAACALSGGCVHHFLDVAPPDARCFGSHDGAWLLLDASHPRDAAAPRAVNVRTGAVRGNRAFNIRTGLSTILPAGLLGQDGQRHDDMVVLATALSSPPDDVGCTAAAIVIVDGWAMAMVAIWRYGWAMAREPQLPPDGFLLGWEVIWHMLNFRPCVRLGVRARYLVVSGGELLMVIRFMPHPGHQPTSKFKVFRMVQRNTADADANDLPVAEYPCAWSELDTLGGRMLFVGHGCSRSYRADQYPGFEAGIYFLDDGMFYDDAVIFGDASQYPCSDNGRWTEDGHVQRCFPRSGPSDHSAPVCLLP